MASELNRPSKCPLSFLRTRRGFFSQYSLHSPKQEIKINVPLVVRLAGTNFEEGKKILDNSGLKLISASDLSDAAKKIVEAIK